jgi:hypothetical protein
MTRADHVQCAPSLYRGFRDIHSSADEKRGMTSFVGGQGTQRRSGSPLGSPAAGGRHQNAGKRTAQGDTDRSCSALASGRMISRPLDGIGGIVGNPCPSSGHEDIHTPSPPTPNVDGWRGGGAAVQSMCMCLFVPSVSTLPFPSNLDPQLRIPPPTPCSVALLLEAILYLFALLPAYPI